MTLGDFIAGAIAQLKMAGVDNPALDARLLACHALGIDRAQLLSQSNRVLLGMEQVAITQLVMRRMQRESVARIIGKREFWGLDFGLNEATLEPRPDSETVVEAVLNLGRERKNILDLGTGTGCLLLSLLHEMPQATGIGIDVNPRAVEQARQNAAALGLNERATFQTGDWFDGVTGKFDVIVSNPPYIVAADIAGLMPEVRQFDPMPALDGGTDGLDPYRHMIPQLARYLNPNGIVAFEFGQGQAASVTALLRQANFTSIAVHSDLSGIKRCVTALY